MKGRMEQEAFEEAIAKYAKKLDSVIPEYEINLHTKRKTIDIRTQDEIKKRKPPTVTYAKKLRTPEGTFNSVRAAAEHYNRTTMWIYNQIHKGEGFTYDRQR